MRVDPIGAGQFALSFQYSQKLVGICKSIPGLRWEPEAKAWCGYADACNEVLKHLHPPKLIPMTMSPVSDPVYDERLRGYQNEGVDYLLTHANEGCILADVMGLGKSAQAIVAVQKLGGHTLIVCPSFVRGVWHKELEKWAHARALGLESLKPLPISGDPQYIVCHYDILHAHIDALHDWRVDNLIIDEAHFLSNSRARRSIAVKELAGQARYRIALTGTPMTNRPKDLWNVVDIICPGRFGKYWAYGIRFCDGHQDTVGQGPEAKAVWNFDGASNLDELKHRLGYFMLRRTHNDVALELPPKTRQVVELKVPPINRLAVSRSFGAADVRRALDVAADGKLEELIPMLKQHVEDGAKVVCFTYRRLIAERIAEDCNGEYIHGEVNQKERDRRIEACAKAPAGSLLVTTIDISSVGVDYSFASVGVFAELTYEPTELAQAESRLHRPGAVKPVLIQYIIGLGTVDELVKQACLSKLEVIDKTVGDPDALAKGLIGESTADDALRDLLEALG